MRTHILALAITLPAMLVLAAPAADDIPPPSGDTVVSPDARLELLFTRIAPITGGLTEGPAVAPDGSIYFTDIPVGEDPGMILRFDPDSGHSAAFSIDSGKANGLIFDSQGRLLACEGSDHGGRCVSRWNVATGEREILAENYQGKRFNAPNDVCLDSQGRIYFTDPRYLGDEPRELQHRAVYKIENGDVTEVTHDIAKPNGIAISPDGKTLYVADHDNGTDKIDATKPAPKQGPMKIYAFPLNPRGQVQGERRTLYDFGEEKGCDGMCVDEDGRIYLTVRSERRPGVLVLDAQGKEVAQIPTGPQAQEIAPGKSPVGLPSNVEFGIGREANVLYVTVDFSLYRIPLKVRGLQAQ